MGNWIFSLVSVEERKILPVFIAKCFLRKNEKKIVSISKVIFYHPHYNEDDYNDNKQCDGEIIITIKVLHLKN